MRLGRRSVVILAAGLLVLGAGAAGAWKWRYAPPPSRTDAPLPAPCRPLAFEGADYVVCDLPPAAYAVSLGHNDGKANALATVTDFLEARPARAEPAVLAMNGGMYRLDLSPLGLLIEDGREIAPLNLGEGDGNFHLRPNGVFFVRSDGSAGVMESRAWAAAPPAARFATQSGPMLVIGGRLHPAFDHDGASRYRRNGVGVCDGVVKLAISRDVVSFGAFARLFRDELRCPDALFLDGAVSALAGPEGAVVGGTFPAGPVIVVERRVDPPGN